MFKLNLLFIIFPLLSVVISCKKTNIDRDNIDIADIILNDFFYHIPTCTYQTVDFYLNDSIYKDKNLVRRINSKHEKAFFDKLYSSNLARIPCVHKYYMGKAQILYYQSEFDIKLFTGKNDFINIFFDKENIKLLEFDATKDTVNYNEILNIQKRIDDFLEHKIVRSPLILNLSELNISQVFETISLNQEINKNTDKFEEYFYFSDILYNVNKTKAVVFTKLESHFEVEKIFFFEKIGFKWNIVFAEM